MNVAVIFGGESCEHDISIITGMQLIKNANEYLDIQKTYDEACAKLAQVEKDLATCPENAKKKRFTLEESKVKSDNYQISNNQTLGITEKEIVTNLENITKKVI